MRIADHSLALREAIATAEAIVYILAKFSDTLTDEGRDAVAHAGIAATQFVNGLWAVSAALND